MKYLEDFDKLTFSRKWAATVFIILLVRILTAVIFETSFPVLDTSYLANVVWNLFGAGTAYILLKNYFSYSKIDIPVFFLSVIGLANIVFLVSALTAFLTGVFGNNKL